MAETGFVTDKTAMTEEEKKSLWQKIIDAIRNFFSKGNIIQQKVEQKLNELDAAMTQAIENGEVTQEQLESIQDAVEELTKKTEELTKSMDGKVEGLTPEDVEKTLGELTNKIDGIVNAKEAVKEMNLEGQVARALSLRTKDDPELRKELFGTDNRGSAEQFLIKDFAEDFKKNARVFESPKLPKDQMLLEYKGQVFLATANFKKNDRGAVAMGVSLSDSPFTVDEITKEPDAFKQIKAGAPSVMMMRQLCHNNGYEYRMDISDKERFIGRFADKVVQVDNNIECMLNKETGNLHVRDTNTGEMLVVAGEGNTVTVTNYLKSDDINDTSKTHTELVNWHTTEKGTSSRQYELRSTSASTNLLLFNKEMSEFLTLNGVDKAMQTKTFSQETDTPMSVVVSAEGRAKVNALFEECKNNANFEGYSVEMKESKDGRMYLNASDGENTMAFVFDEGGNPTAINFKDELSARSGNGGRFETVFDVQANRANEHFQSYRASESTSKSFGQLFTVMYGALNGTGDVKHIEAKKDDNNKDVVKSTPKGGKDAAQQSVDSNKDKSNERKGEER